MKELIRQFGGGCIAAASLLAVLTILASLAATVRSSGNMSQMMEAESAGLLYTGVAVVPLEIYTQSVPAGEEIPVERCFAPAANGAVITNLSLQEDHSFPGQQTTASIESVDAAEDFSGTEGDAWASDEFLYFPKAGVYLCRLVLRQQGGVRIPYEIRMIANEPEREAEERIP